MFWSEISFEIMFWLENSFRFLLWQEKFKYIFLNLCFDKGNQSDQYLQVIYCIFSNQICFLTRKVKKIVLNFEFWQIKSNKFMFWQEKFSKMTCIFLWRKDSNKFIRICVLQVNLCQKLFFLQNMLCTEIVSYIQNNFCTHHVLQKEELLTKITCKTQILINLFESLH